MSENQTSNMESENKKRDNPLVAKHKSSLPPTRDRLPSRGIIYKGKNVLDDDVIDGEVAIYPMRLREELKMKSIVSIFEGTAVKETIEYCVPQVLDAEQLASEDVDFLLTCIKKISQGNKITFKQKCFKKDNNDQIDLKDKEEYVKKDFEGNQEELTINEKNIEDKKESSNVNITGDFCEFSIPIDHFLKNRTELDEEQFEKDSEITVNNFKIKLKPTSFKSFRELSTMSIQHEDKIKNPEFPDFVTDFSNKNLLDRIESVDDITDQEQIYQWVDMLDSDARNEIYEKMIKLNNWGINFEYDLECKECGMTRKTDMAFVNPLYFFLTS